MLGIGGDAYAGFDTQCPTVEFAGPGHGVADFFGEAIDVWQAVNEEVTPSPEKGLVWKAASPITRNPLPTSE